MNTNKAERIYNLMLGNYDLAVPCGDDAAAVENEFTPGSYCAQLEDQIFLARVALSERLGCDIDDRDILLIVDGYEQLLHYLMLRICDYFPRHPL